MLELPEVLTLSKQANDVLSGKTITQVFNATKPHKFTFYSGDPLEYGKLLVGKTILSSKGYGMFVDFYLSGNVIMNIGDGVSARYYNPGDKVPANYQLLLTFEDESFLVFTVAMYGFISAYPDGVIDNKYYTISRESISPLSDAYTEAEFEKLFASAKKTLTAMTSGRGRDTQTDLYGNEGGYKTILSSKTWKNPCPRCGSVIVKEAYLGGSVYYCPECQKIRKI